LKVNSLNNTTLHTKSPFILEQAKAIIVEADSGFFGSFNMLGMILSTDVLGSCLSKWSNGGDVGRSGLEYFKKHCTRSIPLATAMNPSCRMFRMVLAILPIGFPQQNLRVGR